MVEQFELGDRIEMRKPHACGSNNWTVIRTGADVKIRCAACGRIGMMERAQFLRRAKKNLGKREDHEA